MTHHSLHTTHFTPHHLSYRAHLTPLISQHSSYATSLSPVISQHSNMRYSSYTTQLIPNAYSGERHKTSHVGLSGPFIFGTIWESKLNIHFATGPLPPCFGLDLNKPHQCCCYKLLLTVRFIRNVLLWGDPETAKGDMAFELLELQKQAQAGGDRKKKSPRTDELVDLRLI